jgi:hypothetical protein
MISDTGPSLARQARPCAHRSCGVHVPPQRRVTWVRTNFTNRRRQSFPVYCDSTQLKGYFS